MKSVQICRTLGALAVLGGATGAFAQAAPPTPGVVEAARVDLVNLEVFVAGKDGRAVRGLRKEDFEVLEDGKPVAVTNLAAVFAGTPAASPPAPPGDGAAGAAGGETGEGPASTPEELFSLVFYIDNANISASRRNEVYGHLDTLLHDLLAGGKTQVMLVSGGPSVRIRQPFTSRADAVAATLATLKRDATEIVGSQGADSLLVSRVMDNTSMPAPGGGGGPGGLESIDTTPFQINTLLIEARSAAEAEYDRTRAQIRSMTQFVASLSPLPGRKVVFYVGNGLPMRPGLDLLQKFEARYANSGVAPGFTAAGETSRFNVTELLRDLTRRANAARVTIDCVDTAGDGGRGGTALDSGLTSDPSLQTGGAMGLRQSLDTMAAATGGRTVSSGAGLGLALSRAFEDLQSYYSLAYEPPHGHDGAYHTIRVRVKREGTTVHAREGYLDWGVEERMATRSLGGLLFDITSNPLGATISARQEGQGTRDTYPVAVLVAIPLGSLLLRAEGDGHQGSVSLWFASLDPEHRVNQAAKQVFPIRIPNEKLLTAVGQAAGYTFRLNLHKGQHRVAVTVRDDLGETASTLATTFTVGDDATPPASS